MWHLIELDKSTIDWYLNTFEKDVFNGIQNHRTLCHKVKKLLNADMVHKLLISKPDELYPLAKRVEQQIIDWKLWNDSKEHLKQAFNYDGRISSKQGLSYILAGRIGTKTCVYCNRIYAFTVSDGANGGKVVRPDFDHWLSKADHPLTSMSIYNLIPSCPICNRGIKFTREFTYGTHVHPYESADEPSFEFKYKRGAEPGSWEIGLQGGTVAEQETAKVLETEAVYKPYAAMEVKDILNFIYENPPEYINDLYTKVLSSYGGSITPEGAYKAMFGTPCNAKDYLDRPLSKLKHDILKQAVAALGLSIKV